MKIGLFGGVYNSMYNTTKALRKGGFDATYIKDPLNWQPVNQPLWEELRLTLDYSEVMKWNRFDKEKYKEIEFKYNWKDPEWVRVPEANDLFIKYFTINNIKNHLLKKIVWDIKQLFFYLKLPIRDILIPEFQKYDLLIISGVISELIVKDAKKPYIIWPHGGDIRLAAGVFKTLREFYQLPLRIYLRDKLEDSFKKAMAVASHDPTGIAGDLKDISAFLKNVNYVWLPLPYEPRKRLPRKERLNKLLQLISSFSDKVQIDKDLCTYSLIIFVPSRIDFFWKSQDILIKAVAKKKIPIFLIFCGWGKDYQKAIKLASSLNFKDLIFLPFAVSKPLLFDLMDSVDIVVDQFKLGSYGSAAIEAMAGGNPVMMYINEEKFRSINWDPPPVINTKSELEIESALDKILNGRLDLEVLSQEVTEWFLNKHSYSKFNEIFRTILFSYYFK